MFKKYAIMFTGAVIITIMSGCALPNVEQKSELCVQSKEPAKKEITISCAGDCTLGTDAAFGGETFTYEAEKRNNDYGYFLNNVKEYFEKDDLTIVNFEGTLTNRGTRQDKTFAFRGDPEYVKILKYGSVEVVTLANNHSRDYGEISEEDTKKYLEEAGIVWFENLNVKVMECNNIKVGLIGLNALDGSASNNLSKAMEQAKTNGAQIVIVQIHWGIEGSNYPTETQVALAHRAIDEGADLVIGHHPHVLQGMECYKGKMIVYSVGNFCFGGNQNPRDKDTMIYRQRFVMIDETIEDYSDYEVIACSISSSKSRNNYQPTPAEGSEKLRIEEKIQRFSDKLGSIKIKFGEGR